MLCWSIWRNGRSQHTVLRTWDVFWNLIRRLKKEAPFPTLGGMPFLKNHGFVSQLLLELVLFSQLPFESLNVVLFILFLGKTAFANNGKFSGVLVMLCKWLAWGNPKGSHLWQCLGAPKSNTNRVSLMLCNLLKVFYVCSVEHGFTVLFFLEQARKLIYCTAISHMFFSQLFFVEGRN